MAIKLVRISEDRAGARQVVGLENFHHSLHTATSDLWKPYQLRGVLLVMDTGW
jgi:hypothetical protein